MTMTPSQAPLCRPAVRYVYLQQVTVNYMQMCEVLVYNANNVNVAVNKPTRCYSQNWNMPSSRAVDGSGDYTGANYYQSSGASLSEFWQVDLLTTTELSSITFYNFPGFESRMVGNLVFHFYF